MYAENVLFVLFYLYIIFNKTSHTDNKFDPLCKYVEIQILIPVMIHKA